MKNDEYNKLNITNEGKNPSFEFGNTQDAEFTSFTENRSNIRDEVNDNPAKNESHKQTKKEERRESKEKSSDNNSSNNGGNASGGGSSSVSSASSASASSVGTTVATAAGASLVGVATLSTLVGINVFFNGKCNMNKVEAFDDVIAYELDLTDINNDECIIKLEYQTYAEVQGLIEGNNIGTFNNLMHATEYTLSVIDLSYNDYVMYQDKVSTTGVVIEYTVSFDTDGGSAVSSQKVRGNGRATVPAAPYKTGFEFDGWYTTNDLVDLYDFDTLVKEDITLYAGWKEKIPVGDTYTISFDANGGEGYMEPIVVEAGSTYYLPSSLDFTPPDGRMYSRNWWFVNGTRRNAAIPITVNSDLVVANDWDYAAMIYFDANGGSGEREMERTSGGEFTFPECDFEAPEGKKFKYWTYRVFEEETRLDFYPGDRTYFQPSNESEIRRYTIYPVWEDINIYYTVSFVTNGGTEVESQTVLGGTCAARPDDPQQSDAAFLMWTTAQNPNTPFDFENTPITEDLTLYASWTYITKYDVVFYTYGGTSIDTIQVEEGNLVTRPEDPIKDNYIFAGWYINPQFSVEYTFEEPVYKTTFLYAKWEEAPVTSELKFRAESINFNQDEPSLTYSYSYNTTTNPYSTFIMAIQIPQDEVEERRLGLYITPTGGATQENQTLNLDDSTAQALGYLIEESVSYQILGYNSSTQETEVLDEGCFYPGHMTKGYIGQFQLGDEVFEVNNAQFKVCLIQGQYFLPVTLYVNDYNSVTSGRNLFISYSNGSYYSTNDFTYKGGTAFVLIDAVNLTTGSASIPKLYFMDADENVLLSTGSDGYAEDVFFVVADPGSVFGFEVDAESFGPSETPRFRIIANPTNNGQGITYGDIGLSNAQLTFIFDIGYHLDPVSFTANLEFDDNADIRYYIDFTIDNYDTFLDYLRRYPAKVELSYDGLTYPIRSYDGYSFRVM